MCAGLARDAERFNMSSLSISAGDYPNPNNTHVINLDNGMVHYSRWLNSVQTHSNVPWMVANRGLVYDLCAGTNLRDFHKRKNSGELLPYTKWLNVSHECKTTGSNRQFLDFTTKGGSHVRYEYFWGDGKALPMNIMGTTFEIAKLTKIDTVLSNLGVSPHHYVQRAAAKLYSRGWDALTFLAEFHQVVRMFRGCVTQFLDLCEQYAREVKNSKALYFNGLLPTFNAWLQGRYGWRILVYDIQDINKLIETIDEEQLTRAKERVGESFNYSEDNSRSLYASWYRNTSDLTSYKFSVRGSIIADFMPNRIQLNPVVTAWELVPYSFVVDWFFSIGRALEALSFLAVNNLYTAATGIYCEVDRSVSSSVIPDSNWTSYTTDVDSWSASEKWTYKERVPAIVSYLPSLNVNLNYFKVLDLVALIGQALRKLF